MSRQTAGRGRAVMATSGNRIREFRIARGWRVDELAERVGTTQSTISRLEAGTRGLTVDWLRRIALVLQIRAGDLIDEDDGSLFATVLGGFPANESVPDYVVGMLHDSANTYPVAIPKPLSTSRPIQAFETQRGFVYCEEVFPSADDLGRAFVTLYRSTDVTDMLSVRILEKDCARMVLYSRSAAPSHRTFPVGDKRILRTWRVLSEYRELGATLPLTI